MNCKVFRYSNNFIAKLKNMDWTPSLAILAYEEWCFLSKIQNDISFVFPEIVFIGSSSCQGFMDSFGVCIDEGECSILLIGGEGVQVGAHCIEKEQSIEENTIIALKEACKLASCPGKKPDIVLNLSSPGDEEAIIRGIVSYSGDDVCIFGGSSADNEVSGNWSQLCHRAIAKNSVNIAVIFLETKFSSYFNSGYEEVAPIGLVTKKNGREVLEIDHRPAAEVYNEHTGNLFSNEIVTRPTNILAKSTLCPIGRKVELLHNTSYFKLSHPSLITEGKGLVTFTDIDVGESLYSMRGHLDFIIDRSMRVIDQALNIGGLKKSDVSGILMSFCAGCRLALGEDITKVYEKINNDFLNSSIPFLSFFSFGEQGQICNKKSVHGNLMISVLAFSRIRRS